MPLSWLHLAVALASIGPSACLEREHGRLSFVEERADAEYTPQAGAIEEASGVKPKGALILSKRSRRVGRRDQPTDNTSDVEAGEEEDGEGVDYTKWITEDEQPEGPVQNLARLGRVGGKGRETIIVNDIGNKLRISRRAYEQLSFLKCKTELEANESIVANQQACEDQANQNGHLFYQFRGGTNQCVSSPECNRPRITVHPWKVLTKLGKEWVPYHPKKPSKPLDLIGRLPGYAAKLAAEQMQTTQPPPEDAQDVQEVQPI